MLPLIVLAVLAAVVFWAYNSLVRLKVMADAAWSDVDVQLKRRHDLVPNLVETVKGYAGHERGTLEAVIDARSRAMGASGPAQQAEAEGQLTHALRSLLVVAEAYPELRASENFSQLQQTLQSLEDGIQNARRYYNAVVRDLNTKIAQFPTNLIALSFAFKPRQFFEVGEEERAVPKVSF